MLQIDFMEIGMESTTKSKCFNKSTHTWYGMRKTNGRKVASIDYAFAITKTKKKSVCIV